MLPGVIGTLRVDAGARRIFVWPLGDEVRHLELFRERVTPASYDSG
jgi:hypothetical protein